MATTSLWRVHGSIGKVLDYAGNEEKTVTAKEKFTGDSRADSVTDVIDYISRDSATEARKLVSGIGCHPETAKEERENLIQVKFDEMFNKPEYSNWRRYTRRQVNFSPDIADDIREDEPLNSLLLDIAADNRIFFKDESERKNRAEYEAVCQKIRLILKKHPDWADLFIAIRMNDTPVNEYAASVGACRQNITQKLKRAEEHLKKFLMKGFGDV